ncbi:hypothetical protein [Thalassotalea piscium]|uniref:Uncharacterized protein n=1 Tax=Thalassotalea piscium TaxID=1230533 RepID=A0A7X0NF28_9GAMM|nr:hypothetical protein [Thalassotalea piscium]MBB6542287.1 hypothetical protein [Thalassotalea piscium]
MDCNKAKQANIVISIVFALAMLLTSYFIADKDLSQNIVFILIIAWFVPFFYLSNKSK